MPIFAANLLLSAFLCVFDYRLNKIGYANY